MGFIQRLAKKVRGFVAPLGQKIGDGFRAGLKFVGDNVEKVKGVLGKVGDIAGTVGNVAAFASPFAAAIPGIGPALATGLAGLGALGKTVEGGVETANRGVARVDSLRQRGAKALSRAEQLGNKGDAILSRLGNA
tara:strand:- start:3960 stop:4364 length:405 start_codon:yes stop_codon:yes gene_type:complete